MIEVARFRYMFSERRGSLTENRGNADSVSKNDVIACVGHEIVHRDTF